MRSGLKGAIRSTDIKAAIEITAINKKIILRPLFDTWSMLRVDIQYYLPFLFY
jgi:hypothetical protein